MTAGAGAGGAGILVAVPGLGLSVAVARRELERLPVPWSVVTLPGSTAGRAAGTDLAPDQLAEVLLTRSARLTGPRPSPPHPAGAP